MPIHEYKCRDCGKINEFLVGVTMDEAGEGIRCRSCSGNNMEKILSGYAISVRSSTGGCGSGGRTCCGRSQRCDLPPCSGEGACQR